MQKSHFNNKTIQIWNVLLYVFVVKDQVYIHITLSLTQRKKLLSLQNIGFSPLL